MWAWILSWFKKKETQPAPVVGMPPGTIVHIDPPVPGSVAVSRPQALPPGNHYASRNRILLEAEYEYLWPQARVTEAFAKESFLVVDWALKNKAVFQMAEAETKVPWWLIAGINNLEMGANLNGTILNGDPWKEKTRHYPSGLGPWKNWLDAAIWGLRYEAKGWGFDLTKFRWTVGGAFYFAEAYNGFNVRAEMGAGTRPPYASSYIYSGTQFYQSGKKIEKLIPGQTKTQLVFDPNLVSKSLGLMAFARAMQNHGEDLFHGTL